MGLPIGQLVKSESGVFLVEGVFIVLLLVAMLASLHMKVIFKWRRKLEHLQSQRYSYDGAPKLLVTEKGK